MTPDQLAVATTVLNFLSKWPIWALLLIACVIGPWLAIVFLVRIIERNQEKRLGKVIGMYESNVKLVEFAESIGSDYKQLALMVNTALTTLVTLIEKNMYCPLVRNDRLRDIITLLMNEDKKKEKG